MKSFLRKYWLFLTILAFGIFLRSYKAIPWFTYGHDQDLAGWIIRDILKEGHLRLIGQETSSEGIFIGPLFYYLQIPFYLMTLMDPVGSLLLPILLGAFAIYSYYFVFSRVFDPPAGEAGKRVGLIASFVYAVSNYIIFVDREIAPTMPVMLWGVWYFYSLILILKGNQKGWILGLGLMGLVWHVNMGLAILSPLLFLVQFLSKKKIDFRKVFLGGLIFFILMSPFFVFEARHGFNQVRAVYASITTNKDYVSGTSRGIDKANRVIFIVKRNTNGLLFGNKIGVPFSLGLFVLSALFVFLVLKRKISGSIAFVILAWQILYVTFFTFNPLDPSEYYFNGMNVVWILLISVTVGYLFEKKKKSLAFLMLGVFAGLNLYSFVLHDYPRNGYRERKSLIDFIEKDSKERGYSCISISYIVSPGYNLGYRYLFYLRQMHVNRPSSGSPVYSIVFPQSLVNGIDKGFGALGLVLPDYQRYTSGRVKESCSGGNSNLTDPMPGFTK